MLIVAATTSFVISSALLWWWLQRGGDAARPQFELLCKTHKLMGSFGTVHRRRVYPAAIGNYRGRLVRIESMRDPSTLGRDLTRVTLVQPTASGVRLEVRARSFGLSPDVEPAPLADSPLAQEVVATCAPPQLASELLSSALADRWLRCLPDMDPRGVTVAEGTLVYVQEGLLNSAERRRRVEVMLELLADLADALPA